MTCLSSLPPGPIAQAAASVAEVLFRTRSPIDRGQAHQAIHLAADAVRDLRRQLDIVTTGGRAESILADRQSLTEIESRPPPADSRAADRLKQALQRTKEQLTAALTELGIAAGPGTIDQRLNAMIAAAADVTHNGRSIDFAAAAREWAAKPAADPFRGLLIDRLAVAAEAEALRPNGDLIAARDFQLASKAAAAIDAGAEVDSSAEASPTAKPRPSTPDDRAAAAPGKPTNARPAAGKAGGHPASPAARKPAVNEKTPATPSGHGEPIGGKGARDLIADAVQALQRQHELTRLLGRATAPPTAEGSRDSEKVLAAAIAARARLTQAASEPTTFTPPTGHSGRPPAVDGSVHDSASSRPVRAEDLAPCAGAESAAHEYERVAELDSALQHKALASTEPTAAGMLGGVAVAAGSSNAAPSTPTPLAAIAEQVDQNLRGVRRAMATAEALDAAAEGQKDLSRRTAALTADADPAAVAADQREIADRIAHAAASPAGSNPPASVTPDDASWRDRAQSTVLACQRQLLTAPRQLADLLAAAATLRDAIQRSNDAHRAADSAPPDRQESLARAAAQATADALDAAHHLDDLTRPLIALAPGMADSLAPFDPDLTASRQLVTDRLRPSIAALIEAVGGLTATTGDPATRPAAFNRLADAANEIRQALDAAQRVLLTAQNDLSERDPLVAAKWFARAASEDLSYRPPEWALARRHQDAASAALGRAWDAAIHAAAARRLATVPAYRPILSGMTPFDRPFPATADPSQTLAAGHSSPSAPHAPIKDWRRLRPRDADDLTAAPRDADPPGYEAALKAYFEAINKPR